MLHKAVLDRINVHVIHMGMVIGFVADQMLSIAPLPNARSPRFTCTEESRSTFGKRLENPILIRRQRIEKSDSSGGNSITQCIWSGKTTHPWLERDTYV